jgi:abortive phage resistance protein AbiGi (putative antitoxin)
MLQRYVSEELTHFVGRSLQNPEAQYRLLTENILASGKLGRLPEESFHVYVSGDTHPASNLMVHYPMVCFCDIPIPDITLHMEKYSRFGLALKKRFLIPKGARPVFYVPQTTFGYGAGDFSFIQNFHNTEAALSLSSGPGGAVANSSDEVLQLVKNLCKFAQPFTLHLFGFMKFFDPETADTDPTNYYMEREWRLPGALTFALSDVSRIILPSSYASRLRIEFPQYYGQLTFSD